MPATWSRAAAAAPKATLLTTINALDPIYFSFDASEALFLKARRARESGAAPSAVEIKLQDEADYRWHGRLDFTDNGLDTQSGTIRLRAVVANPAQFLTPGMFGNMRLSSSGTEPALLVPDSAVQADQARKIVLVVAQGRQRHAAAGRAWAGGRWPARHPLRPDHRRPRDHQRDAAGDAGHQGAGPRRHDRAGCDRGRARIRARPAERRSDTRRELSLQPSLIEAAREAGRNLMRLSRFFITRPIFAAVIAILITVMGAIAYFALPVSQYPDIVPPTVTVSATYPGADAETVASTVAAPIEQEINGVDNMLYMSSQSTGDGQPDDHRHLQAGHRPQRRAGAGAEPRRDRRFRGCPRKCSGSASSPARRRPTS